MHVTEFLLKLYRHFDFTFVQNDKSEFHFECYILYRLAKSHYEMLNYDQALRHLGEIKELARYKTIKDCDNLQIHRLYSAIESEYTCMKTPVKTIRMCRYN